MEEKLNFYLVTCDIEYTSSDKEDVNKTTAPFIITSISDKITKKTLIDLHMYAAEKFVQLYQNIKEVTSVELRSVSFLGHMTKEEFEGNEDKTNEDNESV